MEIAEPVVGSAETAAVSFCCARLELADELRVHVAARVDLIDQGRARGDGGRGVGGGASRVAFELGGARAARLELGAHVTQRLHGGRMRADALAVEGGQRGDRPIRAPHIAHVVHREEQAEVAAAAQLVELHEPLLEARDLGGLPSLERVEMRGGVGEILRGRGERRLGVLLDLGADVPFDLEAPQLDEQRLLARREVVGFLAERLEAVVDALLLVGGLLCGTPSWPQGRWRASDRAGKRVSGTRDTVQQKHRLNG